MEGMNSPVKYQNEFQINKEERKIEEPVKVNFAQDPQEIDEKQELN